MTLDFPQSVLDQLTDCPFCGSKLSNKKADEIRSDSKKSTEKDQFSNRLLDEIISEKGVGICSSERSEELGKIIKEKSDADKDSREILILFHQYDFLSRLYDSISASASDRKEEITSMVEFLCRKFDIPANSAKQMCLSIANSMGINAKSISKMPIGENPLPKLIQNYIAEKGIYRFGSPQSIEDIIDLCEDLTDRKDFLILFRSGIIMDMRNALGDSVSTRTKVFIQSIEKLNKLYVPETKAIAMLRKLAEGIGFSTENNYFVDKRDGQVYRIVDIGNQTWMAENFRFKTQDSYFFNNNKNTINQRGLLYTWEAAKKACPPGWRLPSRDDYMELESYIYREENDWDSDDDDELDSVNDYLNKKDSIMKFCLNPKNGKTAMNFFGFSATRGGRLNKLDSSYGTFEDDEPDAVYWTSTLARDRLPGNTLLEDLVFTYQIGMFGYENKENAGIPVRYIKEK
jgi:uncharacterized protein (TIGR02145 family)